MSEIANFKSLEFTLYDCIAQLRSICAAKELPGEHIRELDETLERIKTRHLSIAVMGEFKRGKSTFINALLGMRILPADVTPTTATINRIVYGDEPGVTIKYKDGGEKSIALLELSEYVTKLTEEAERRAAEIDSAVIRYPTTLCANHIEIIDTPGLNDDAAMTEISMSVAERVDAVIIVLSALSPFSELETKFAAQLLTLENIDALFFVVSFIDQIEEDERELFLTKLKSRIINAVRSELEGIEALSPKAEQILGEINLCAVSSTEALDAIVRGDNKLLKKSNLETMKTSLFRFLTASQGYTLIQKSKAVAVKYCAILEQSNMDTLNELDVQNEWFTSAGSRLGSYRDTGRERFCDLHGRFDDILSELNQMINREKNACAKRCVETMSAGNDVLLLDELSRFTEFKATESQMICNELTPKLMNFFGESVRSIFNDFNSSERCIIDETISMIAKTSDKELRTLNCLKPGFEMTCAVPPPGFRWMTEGGEMVGQRRWLSEINASYAAFVENWKKYFNELFSVWEDWINIEHSHIALTLLDELNQALINHNAQKSIIVKSLEKERLKLDEILQKINKI